MVDLVPYRSVDSLLLGDSVDRATELFGVPRFDSVNRSGQLKRQYELFTLIFHQDTRELQECVVPHRTPLRIDGKEFSWTLAEMHALCAEDGDPLEYYGSIVLFNKGIAMSGVEEDAESDRTVGIFAQDVWASLKSKMKPFKYE